jgi:site-specific DNA-cytosine methylase
MPMPPSPSSPSSPMPMPMPMPMPPSPPSPPPSPECTNHSLAKGARRRKPQAGSLFDDGPAGDDEQDRSRATMLDVWRFADVKMQQGRDSAAVVLTEEEIDDCGFRMFQLHEIAAAMAFDAEYQVLGNKRERMAQYGNAVTPLAMELLVGRVLEVIG